MRDHALCLQNQLMLKISSFRLSDLVDGLFYIFEENLRSHDTSFQLNVDPLDSSQVVFSDQERLKQIIANIVQLSLKFTTQGQIKLDIKNFNAQSFMISIKEYGISKDEQFRNQIYTQVKTISSLLRSKRTSNRELDLSNNLEIQISAIIAYQLSGSLKRGLEFSTDKNGCSTFTLFVESCASESRQLVNSGNDIGPIRVLGQAKYFETSLSMLLAQAQDSSALKSNLYDEEKLFSLSQLSKQFSIKPSEVPIDLQSAYFSQISKIRQDSQSKAFANSSSQYKQLSNQASFTQDQIIQTQLKPKSNNKNSSGELNNNIESMHIYSNLDFGESSLNPLAPPELLPKLLKSVIKFKLTNDCCSKVLMIDNDHFSQVTLNLFLQKHGIKSDRAFNGRQALEQIHQKLNKKCRCGNNCYLLFFMEINLPV